MPGKSPPRIPTLNDRRAMLVARLRAGRSLVLTLTTGGAETWSLCDGTRVDADEAGFLWHYLQLAPSSPGLFPDALPQAWACNV